MSWINTASRTDDTYELSSEQLDVVCGGSPSMEGRARIAAVMHSASEATAHSIVTGVINTVKSVGGALGSLIR